MPPELAVAVEGVVGARNAALEAILAAVAVVAAAAESVVVVVDVVTYRGDYGQSTNDDAGAVEAASAGRARA